MQTLLLDKTGTITLGNRMASAFIPATGTARRAGGGGAARLAGRRDAGGPLHRRAGEGKLRTSGERELGRGPRLRPVHRADPDVRPRHRRHGRSARARPRRSQRWVAEQGGTPPADSTAIVERIARSGGTPLVGRRRPQLLGVIDLKDIVKQGISERFAELRAMGIRTVMITGDNPLTAAAIAAGGGRRRLPGRGHPRGQDGADQGASRRAASSSR